MSVQVAVRVRPLNKKEKDAGEKICIEMQNQSTRIQNFISKDQTFTFDFSFCSSGLVQNSSRFDSENSETDDEKSTQEKSPFKKFESKDYKLLKSEEKPSKNKEITDQQSHSKTGKKILFDKKTRKPFIASQNTVFKKLGKPLIDSAMEGINGCIFAYGQTGSGKSFSMMGEDGNHGIIPRMIECLFDSIKEKTNKNTKFNVQISMLEIYNEKVQDLFVKIHQRPDEGLKIKLGPENSFFVKDLSWEEVSSRNEVLRCFKKGNKHRSVAATQMNASSSRAHTIVTLKIERCEEIFGNMTRRFSEVHLVDLAGSEKVGKTGVTGERLREGCHINKSLSCLGRIVSVLADQASGRRLKEVVPYRESPLTMILKNALGGNAKTVMLCTLSPALSNFPESLSTLKYAMRAKNIKCKAIINESEADRKIRILKEENEQLKQELKEIKEEMDRIRRMSSYYEDSSANTSEKKLHRKSKESDFQISAFKLHTPEKEKKLEASQIKYSQIIEKLEKTQKKVSIVYKKNQKRSRRGSVFQSLCNPTEDELGQRGPCLVNITEDKATSGQYEYDLKKLGEVTLTNYTEGIWKEDKIICTKGHIQPNHAVFKLTEEGVPIVEVGDFAECHDSKAKFAFKINGDPISGETVTLQHRDRVVIGRKLVFVVDLRGNSSVLMLSTAKDLPNYEEAINEIRVRKQSANGLMGDLKTEESESLEEIGNLKQQNQDLKKSLKRRDDRLEEFQKMLTLKEIELQEMKKKNSPIFEEDETGIVETGNSLFPRRNNTDLSIAYKTAPKRVKTMNALAKKTKRKITFSYLEGNLEQGLPHRVRIDNMEMGWADVWDIEKFFKRNRRANDLVKRNKKIKRNGKNDPFYDTPDFVLLGSLEEDISFDFAEKDKISERSFALFKNEFKIWNQNEVSGSLEVEIKAETADNLAQVKPEFMTLSSIGHSVVNLKVKNLQLQELDIIKFYFKIEIQNKITRQDKKFRSQIFEVLKQPSTGSSKKEFSTRLAEKISNFETSCRFEFDEFVDEMSCSIKVFGILKASPNFLIEMRKKQMTDWIRDSEVFVRRSKIDNGVPRFGSLNGSKKSDIKDRRILKFESRKLGTGLRDTEIKMKEMNRKIEDEKVCCRIF